MSTNVQGLNDYLQILRSPDIYPDIAGAGFFMSPLISVVSTIIAFAGIIAMLLVILRIGVDVLLMAGGGSFFGKNIGKFSSISSFGKDGEVPVGDPWAYLKGYGYKIILMLAFIGLMISGYMLPLAGTVTASMGAVITKVADINPVPYIEAVDITTLSLSKQVERSSLEVLMKNYSNHVGNMTSSRQQALKSDDISESEYNNAAVAYAKSYYSAEIFRYVLAGNMHNIRLAAQADPERTLSKGEQELRNFDYTAHLGDVDQILLQKGKSVQNSSSEVSSLEQEAQRAKSAYDNAVSGRSEFSFSFSN